MIPLAPVKDTRIIPNMPTVFSTGIGGNGKVLETTSGGGGTPGGSNGNIQFNENGMFGGFGFWDADSNILQLDETTQIWNWYGNGASISLENSFDPAFAGLHWNISDMPIIKVRLSDSHIFIGDSGDGHGGMEVYTDFGQDIGGVAKVDNVAVGNSVSDAIRSLSVGHQAFEGSIYWGIPLFVKCAGYWGEPTDRNIAFFGSNEYPNPTGIAFKQDGRIGQGVSEILSTTLGIGVRPILIQPEFMWDEGSGMMSSVGIGIFATPRGILEIGANQDDTASVPAIVTNEAVALVLQPVGGAIETYADKVHYTLPSSESRKEFTLSDIALTSGRIPIATTNGRLTDSSSLTFDGTILSTPILKTTTAPTANSTGTVVIVNKTASLNVANAGWMPMKKSDGTTVYIPYWT